MELVYKINNELAGSSEPIMNVNRAMKLLDGRDFKVALISGEIGTQKKSVAQILHMHSVRRSKPMQLIDCSEISSPWIENAFDVDNKESVNTTHKGILCLQNIEALSLKAQGHLLLALEKSTEQNDSLSLIAITRTDLKKAVKDSRFLLGLHEYLSRFHIHMPALRERSSDISTLAKTILKDLSKYLQTKMVDFEPEVIEAFSKYEWPGNLRQLKGTIEQAILHSPEETTFRVEHMPQFLRSSIAPKVLSASADMKLPRQGVVLEELEKGLLKQALEQCLGNQSRAARLLGISRFALRYRMEKYGLFPRTKEEIMAAAVNEWSE